MDDDKALVMYAFQFSWLFACASARHDFVDFSGFSAVVLGLQTQRLYRGG